MRRLLVSRLLLSTRRSAGATSSNLTLHNHNRTLVNTRRNFNRPFGMDEPFEQMAREGEPKCDEPTAAAAPKQEEQADALPELSAREFRVFNRMAEHMDMFVSGEGRAGWRV